MNLLRLVELAGNIDRRIIYALVLITVSFPLIFKITLPLEVSKEVRMAYQAVEELEEGDVILISTDYGPSSAPETQPMLEAILTHAFRKNVKVLLMTHWRFEGLIMGVEGIEKIARRFNKKYGEDYIILGFRPGVSAVMIGLSEDFRNVFLTDYYGRSIDSYPMYKQIAGEDNILNYDDIDLLVGLQAGNVGDLWIRIVNARYGVPMIMGATAVIIPEYFPYLQAGQIKGLIGGLKGAADYEKLVNMVGFGTVGMSAQLFVHTLILVLIFLGNVSLIARRFFP